MKNNDTKNKASPAVSLSLSEKPKEIKYALIEQNYITKEEAQDYFTSETLMLYEKLHKDYALSLRQLFELARHSNINDEVKGLKALAAIHPLLIQEIVSSQALFALVINRKLYFNEITHINPHYIAQLKQSQIPILYSIVKKKDVNAEKIFMENHAFEKIFLLQELLSYCLSKNETEIFYSIFKSKNVEYIHAKDSEGNTILHKAIETQNQGVIEFLIKETADINDENNQGVTPFHVALETKNKEIIFCMIHLGADITLKNREEKTPHEIAIASEQKEVVDFIEKRIEAINRINYLGESPLHEALRLRQFDEAKILILNGANLDVKNHQNFTPLHKAVQTRNEEIVALLLKKKVDVNERDGKGNSALHIAVDEDNMSLFLLLIQKGGDIHAHNNYRNSLLHIAAKKNAYDIARFLIEKNSDIHGKNLDEETPFDIAKINAFKKIMQLLIDKGASSNQKKQESMHSFFHAPTHIIQYMTDITMHWFTYPFTK